MHPQPSAQARTDWKTVFQKLGGAVIPRVVNLNEAPAGVLSALPGLNFRIAAAIVASRVQAGRFRSVEELWSRGLLPVPPGPELLERLVVTAVQDRR
ncbi:helix-hairpin-helix domain-containing protein [Kribbella steppae]|uniref:helix-hairpin-helix domain-containing protein n=1 Tax=Kribbella steppae TaxID=2512223 RepID=UPI00104A7336|nr:helix-hairpin-helix domain-containing protein [Kribbella steppae]